MVALTTVQYDYLSAIDRGDYVIAYQLFPYAKGLWVRRLYTAKCQPNGDGRTKVWLNTAKLTQAGRDAMMCYQYSKAPSIEAY